MKQIIKVESYFPIKELIEKYNIYDKEFFYNRTDLELVRGDYWDNDMICKQTSFQYYDFNKGEWVVLPNPKQPKIKIDKE